MKTQGRKYLGAMAADQHGEITSLRKGMAWGVHFLTATGAVVGMLAVLAIVEQQWKACFLWLLLAAFIDSIDGALARAAKVKTALPRFDGALLDNIVDYLTYVVVPAVFLYVAVPLPRHLAAVAAGLIFLINMKILQNAPATVDNKLLLRWLLAVQ